MYGDFQATLWNFCLFHELKYGFRDLFFLFIDTLYVNQLIFSS